MAYDDRETGLTVEDRGSKLGLPQNQDAEANVLAAMLLSPEVVEEAQVELQPDDFYRPIHKTIYTAMVDMYNSRIPIDSISLIDYLRSINKLDAVGGEAYILELMGQTLSLVNWQHHAAIVRRDSMLRELIGATNEINALAYNAPTDTKEVVELAESKLLKVTAREVKSSYKTLTEFMVEAITRPRKCVRPVVRLRACPRASRHSTACSWASARASSSLSAPALLWVRRRSP